jgi:prolyl oligopeptidase
MLELRRTAETRLGDKFDIRAFHDQLLGAGALPLDLLESRMNTWMTSQL